MNNEATHYYTRHELCDRLRISESAIKRYEKQGLRRTDVGPRLVRYSQSDVEDFLRRREGPGDEGQPPTSNG